MFLHVCVILFTGGGGGVWSRGVPAWSPPDQAGTPHHHHHPTPRDQTPPGPGIPAWARHPPPEQQTLEYGQRSAGTHPTGMHSCFISCHGDSKKNLVKKLVLNQ